MISTQKIKKFYDVNIFNLFKLRLGVSMGRFVCLSVGRSVEKIPTALNQLIEQIHENKVDREVD